MGVKVVRPSGRKDWYLQICTGGVRTLRHVGNREAAYAAKSKIEEAIATKTFVPPKGKDAAKEITFAGAIARWKREHVEVRLKPSSIAYYANIVKNWLLPTFGEMELSRITRRDVKQAVAAWKESRENPPEAAEPEDGEPKKRKQAPGKGLRNIPNVLRSLGSFFSWAIEEELLTVNPATNPGRIYKVDAAFRGDFLRPEEVSPYLEGVRKKAPRYFSLLRTMTFAGLRVGEAIALSWGDIDWNGKFLTIQRSSWQGNVGTPKTESSIRRVDLSPEMIEVLQQHRKAVAAQSLKAGRPMPDTVFVNEVGKPMDVSKIRRAHDLGLKEAGLRHIRVHDLRGTFTAIQVSAGTPIYHVSKALGHSDTATTERHYASLVPGAAREMPNVMERYIQAATGRNANGMRTEGGAKDRTPLSVESVSS